MSLKDIQKKLYQSSSDVEKRKLGEDVFSFKNDSDNKKKFDKREEEISRVNEQRAGDVEETKRKLIRWGLVSVGVIVFLGISFLVFTKIRERSFSDEKISLSIEGLREIKSGQEVTYTITVSNQNRVSLENSILHFSFSDELSLADSSPLTKEGFNGAKITIGSIEPGKTSRYEIKLKTFGPRDKDSYLNTTLSYRPSNFTSSFEKKSQMTLKIQSSLLTLTLLPVKEVASGEIFEIQALVENQSNLTYNNVQLKMEYPQGFSFQSATPAPTEGNYIWDLGTITPKQNMKFVIVGTIAGNMDTNKNFKATLGEDRGDGNLMTYTTAEGISRIIAQRLQIEQVISGSKNNTANANDALEYVIKFRNNTTQPLRDLILTEKISSPVLDKTAVIADRGFYDSEKDEIVWKGADIPTLKVLMPGQEGFVKFNVRIRNKFPMENDNDKNFSLISWAEIESLDIDSPLGQNKRLYSQKSEVKINSKLVFSVTGSYNDGEIPNQGPIPMKVGNETSFTLRFNLLNTSNDLKNVVLTTSLAPGISWKNNFFPEVSGLEFNERTNEIKWLVGNVEAGTGFISPAKFLAFQIGANPSINQTSQLITFLNPVKIKALDTFTNQEIEITSSPFNSGDISDINANDARVSAQ